MVSWLSLGLGLLVKIDSIKILDETNMKLVLSKKFMIEPSQCLNDSCGSALESSFASWKRPHKGTDKIPYSK